MSDRLPDGKWIAGKSANPDTQFKPGRSGNPGYQRKARRELVALARESMPKALERARQLLDDDGAEWRAWLEAGKFVLSCSAIGANPGPKSDEDAPGLDVVDQLTVEEVRSLARQSLADEAAEDATDDDSDDETEH